MIDRQKWRLKKKYAGRNELSLFYHTDSDEIYAVFGLWLYFGCNGYKRVPINEIFSLMKGMGSIGKIF